MSSEKSSLLILFLTDKHYMAKRGPFSGKASLRLETGKVTKYTQVDRKALMDRMAAKKVVPPVKKV